MLKLMHRAFWILILFCIPLSACTGSNINNLNNADDENLLPNTSNNEIETENNANSNSSVDTIEYSRSTRLEDVTHWFYYLDVNTDEATLQVIEESDYDMIVIDFIPSEAYNTDYPMAEVIERWHTAKHPKLVIAYIDVGQAESFRAYWEDEWEIGSPEWILGDDPDGWEENYPVAYWYDEYQEIWLGEDGAIQAILDAGFDGIYLDWVEAYDDSMVIEFAEDEGVDPIEEMIWWVGDLGDYARAQNPDFIVIAQNAAELAEYDDYVESIDAIAQEQIWFDGGADNVPPGDCPLPETEALLDSDEYEESLSPACYNQYLEFPDSTLHVSSEWYLEQLLLAQSKGLLIFTIDYAVEEENIDWVYVTSRGYGFIPFVSNRWLNQFLDSVP